MRVWIDLANSPHVALFAPVVDRLEVENAEVLVTVRDHAQTLGLAQRSFPDAVVIGERSPPGVLRKGAAIGHRAYDLRRIASRWRPTVAVSHGSYAQVLAATAARVPAVTMMDYEHQPANHLSFRLARRVLVPAAFPAGALRRFGARRRKVARYDGFKEQLYLGGFRRDDAVLAELGLEPGKVIVVMRPPPRGALYHRHGNVRFDELLAAAASRSDVQVVVLPRSAPEEYRRAAVIVPDAPIDGLSLVAHADLMIGAGGTMNRESALLGTPTYTVFAERMSAVDAMLVAQGRMKDLRDPALMPTFEKKSSDGAFVAENAARAGAIMATLLDALREAEGSRP